MFDVKSAQLIKNVCVKNPNTESTFITLTTANNALRKDILSFETKQSIQNKVKRIRNRISVRVW